MTWENGAVGICAHIQAIKAELPFSLQGFDCDSVPSSRKLSIPAPPPCSGPRFSKNAMPDSTASSVSVFSDLLLMRIWMPLG